MQATTAPTSPLAMVMDLPLSKDSTAARRSVFFSAMSASLFINTPRSAGVVSFQVVSKALRAAATARSTSFSVASQTEVMTSSVEGLMTSNFFLSTPSTHSLLINRPIGWSYLPVAGVDSCTVKVIMTDCLCVRRYGKGVSGYKRR